MLVPIPIVHAGIGLLMALISIPLILQKIPMNRIYGIRVPKAFISNRNWYALNAYGGRLLLVFGLFLLALSALGRAIAPPPSSPWAPVYLVVPLVFLVPVILRIQAFARRLPDR